MAAKASTKTGNIRNAVILTAVNEFHLVQTKASYLEAVGWSDGQNIISMSAIGIAKLRAESRWDDMNVY